MRDVVVRRTNDMHPQWCVRNGPLSRITFSKYTAFALLAILRTQKGPEFGSLWSSHPISGLASNRDRARRISGVRVASSN